MSLESKVEGDPYLQLILEKDLKVRNIVKVILDTRNDSRREESIKLYSKTLTNYGIDEDKLRVYIGQYERYYDKSTGTFKFETMIYTGKGVSDK